MAVAFALPASAPAQIARTHAEFDLTHTEEIGAGNIVALHDTEPGQDGEASIHLTGAISGTHGLHDVTLDASVTPTAINSARLRTFAEHAFTLTGSDPASDVWRVATSSMLARAELIDDLVISNTGAAPASVELYFLVTGQSEAVIDLTPPGEVLFDFDTTVRLETATAAPNSGGGLDEQLVSWGGVRYTDLDDSQQVEELVMMAFDLPQPTSFHLETRFELEPHTSLTNGIELATLSAQGLHRASYDDLAAEVVGVVVRDGNGDILPNAVIVAISGHDYPVLDAVPQPPLPDKVIVSPVSATTDLGEYDASVPVGNLIDQSGLSEPFVSGQTGFDAYFAQANAGFADSTYVNNWQSDVSFTLPLQGYLEFELGRAWWIDRLAIWSLTLEDVRVLVRESDVAPWTEVGQYTLPDRMSFYSIPVEVIDLGGQHQATAVRLEIDSVHPFFGSTSYGYAIAGEVAVSAATAVPEPGGWAMACSGAIGLIGLAARRRRRAIRA